MTCACCQTRKAALGPDPRLRWLRLPTCWPCRDLIARMAGWTPSYSGGHFPRAWQRGTAFVDHDPRRAATVRAEARR